jgi:Transposase DDE domain
VLVTGIAWQQLPHELGHGSGMTCGGASKSGSRQVSSRHCTSTCSPSSAPPAASTLACSLRLRLAAGTFGGEQRGPSPVARRKLGRKHHLITDANGILLACLLTAANGHDITQLLPLVEATPPIRGVVGRPRRRPRALLANRATTQGASAGAPQQGNQPAHRDTHDSLRLRSRQPALGTRTDAFLASTVSAPAHPLRADGGDAEAFACSLICLRALPGSFC